jgi:hypothetical protein
VDVNISLKNRSPRKQEDNFPENSFPRKCDYILVNYWDHFDRLCGLVVRVPGYRSRGPGYDSRHCQIFWEVVGLERSLLSLVSTIEELLGRKFSGSGLENREYDRRDPLCWPRNTFLTQKLTLTSATSGDRSVGIVRSWTEAVDFVLFVYWSHLP